MKRRTRFVAALFAIAALAFSQLAVSAFACPNVAAPVMSAGEMPAGPCEQGGNANLCDRHCDYGAASVGHAGLDMTLDVLALPLPWRAEPVTIAATATHAPRELAERSHSPPPLALFGALRI
jgi:hypothetical protein